MAPPEGGWKKGGRLRIQSEENLDGTRWRVVLNGKELTQTQDCGEPYETPYTNCLGTRETIRAWNVEPEMLLDGHNIIKAEMTSGNQEVKLIYVDVAVE